MNAQRTPAPIALTLSTLVLAMSWLSAAAMTAVVALLLSQPIGIPECTSYDVGAQRAGQAIGVMTLLGLLALWAGAVVLLVRSRRSAGRRLLLAVSLPAAVAVTFIVGGASIGAASDAIAPNADHAMCW